MSGAMGKVGESPTGGAQGTAQRLPPGGLLDDGNTANRWESQRVTAK